MEEIKPKKRLFTFKIGYLNYALFALIVAIRAFQPDAERMSDWSMFSWVLMSLPITYPLALYVFMQALYWSLYGIVMSLFWVAEGIEKVYRAIKRKLFN